MKLKTKTKFAFWIYPVVVIWSWIAIGLIMSAYWTAFIITWPFVKLVKTIKNV